jgi:hypothetical protein
LCIDQETFALAWAAAVEAFENLDALDMAGALARRLVETPVPLDDLTLLSVPCLSVSSVRVRSHEREVEQPAGIFGLKITHLNRSDNSLTPQGSYDK